MSTLLELQRRVAAIVTEPLTGRDGMRRRSRDGRSVPAEADALIKPNDRMTSFERLEIYNRQYWFRVLSAIAEDFPGLLAIAGSRKFYALMRAYLVDCPSCSFTLRNLGERLGPWLKEHPEWTAPDQRLALDMARLEWAHIEAFDAASYRRLTLADIETAGGDLRISLQPYIRLLPLEHAVDDLLVEVHNNETSCNASSNAAAGRRKNIRWRHYRQPEGKRIHLAVHRFENSIYYKRLEPEAYRILLALQNSEPLEDAIERSFVKSGIPAEQRLAAIQSWFENWAELGWFCGVPGRIGKGA